MLQEYINKSIKPLLAAEYKRGFSAGVNAEKLVKEKDRAQREYDLLRRGIEQGREEVLKELENDIEEITAREFEELAQLEKEPFGFVGTMDDMTLVLDESEVAV